MNPTKISILRNRLEADGFEQKGGSLRGNCPWRPGADSESFVVNLGDGNGKIGWFDHVAETSGKLSDLAIHYGIVDFEENNSAEINQTEYIYQDEAGRPVYKVVRKGGKKFLQMHHCADIDGWAWGLAGNPAKCGCEKVSMLPYGLPELVADLASPVIVCEGEKDVHTARRLGFVATCNSGGAGKWGKLPKKIYRHFESRPVIVIADNDEAGRKHADEVARSLWPYIESIKVIRFDGPQGYDLTDWVRDGGDKQALQATIDRSKQFRPRIEATDTDNPLASQPPDDEGNAQCVHYLHGKRFLYTDEMGWLKYTGSHWESKGAEASLNRSIVDTLIQRRTLAVQANDEKLVKGAKPSANNVKNARFMFQSIVWASIDEFDADPDLLNCKNGVVNLKSGELTPHEASQRFTYCVNTAYNPAADDGEWVEWLHSTVVPARADDDGRYMELVNWIQMAVGYSLTGWTHEQCLFFLQGPPRAGKGIFLQILDKLLGRPLASGVDFDTFTAKRGGDNQNFDLAPLKTCRLITASESERASMINAKRVKSITGNDPIHCAHKRKAFFTYTPQFKIWLSSNFQIMAAADDDALWSRLRIINFPNCHLGNEDYSLHEQLWEGRAGILKWAIEGAMIWHERKVENVGLGQPDMVRGAVKIHRADNDTVAQFIEDCCSVDPEQYAVGAQLSAAYRDYCNENGIKPLGGRRLGESMRGKGFESKKKRLSPTNVKKCWLGIGLLV